MLLTGEPALVSLSAALLEVVLDHNTDALGRLAYTGLFFFALAYCGSNLVELARLFHVRLQSPGPVATIAADHARALPLRVDASEDHTPRILSSNLVGSQHGSVAPAWKPGGVAHDASCLD